ncbi:cation efflux family-domain-containing protein [Cladochytrium replicatum]|nr:cation efflux family-domain-containing protein [Cladochytrium replicatum]
MRCRLKKVGRDWWDTSATYLLIELRSFKGNRITIVGLASNIGLTIVKGFAGYLCNSASLIADAIHGLSDMVSDFATLFFYNRARKAPDTKYPFGYGKLEPLGSLAVSGLLIGSGAMIGYHSFHLLQELVQASGGLAANLPTAASVQGILSNGLHSHGLTVDALAHGMHPFALAIIGISILLKEALFHITMRIGKKLKSDVLIANAYHHRSDAAGSLVALVGVGGAVFGAQWLDPLGGMLVSGMIIQSGLSVVVPALRELTDASASPDTTMKVIEIVDAMKLEDTNIVACTDVRARKIGPYTIVDLQLQVEPLISVSSAHQITENLRAQVMSAVPDISEVLIHIDSEVHERHEKPRPMMSTSDLEARVTAQIRQSLIAAAQDGIHGDSTRIIDDGEDEEEMYHYRRFIAENAKVGHVTVHFLPTGLEVYCSLSLVPPPPPPGREPVDWRDGDAIVVETGAEMGLSSGEKVTWKTYTGRVGGPATLKEAAGLAARIEREIEDFPEVKFAKVYLDVTQDRDSIQT